MTPRDRPVDAEVDALVTDRYLDGLLAVGEQGAGMALTRRDDDAIALREDLGHATAVLRASLLRVHPSFRFEERLASRLAQLAGADAGGAVAAAGTRPAAVIPFPGARSAVAAADDPLLAAVIDGRLDPADADAVASAEGLRSAAKPLLLGGAITSAAISLVGVALVAWRASRPTGPTMSRAARQAHARRLAALAELAAGVHGGPA